MTGPAGRGAPSAAAATGGLALLDELMANAWRPQVVAHVHGWRLRWASGVTRRASSALAAGGDERVAELVWAAEAFYRARGAAPLVQVSTASAPASLVPYLGARGYRRAARTLVECAPVRDVARRTEPGDHRVEVSAAPTDAWFEAYWSVESARGRGPGDAAVCREVLLRPPLPTAFVAVRRRSGTGWTVAGVGQAVVEQGWAGVQCMATRPGHRRRGVASAVLHALAGAAADRGAGHMYLAVMAVNAGARDLYARAGFRPVHEYCYFARPAG